MTRGKDSQLDGEGAPLVAGDLELIRATIKRKERGEKAFPEFREFIERHESRVTGYVFKRLNNPDTALDVLQEAKYKMFRSGLMPEYTKTPSAYYVTIVKNCLLDAYSARDKHRAVSIDETVSNDSDRIRTQYPADQSWQPDELVPFVNRQNALPRVVEEAFRRVIVKSPKKLTTMTALKMRFFDKKAVQDVASELGIGRPNTVTKMLKRGLVDLKQALASMRREGFPGVEYVYEALSED